MRQLSVLLPILLSSLQATAFAQNTLAVTTERPLTGNYSLKIDYGSSNNAVFVQDNSPANEKTHRVILRLYADEANGFSMADDDKHQIFKARNPNTGVTLWRVHIRRITENDPTSKYRVVLWCNHAGAVPAAQEFVGEFYLLTNKWQLYNFEWQAESAPGTNDGICRAWKASNTAGARQHINMTGTSSFGVEVQLLGAFDYIQNLATVGPIYYDDFESFRSLSGLF